jgi:hypothetical protein
MLSPYLVPLSPPEFPRAYNFKKEPLQGDLSHVFNIFGEVGV